MLDAGVAAVVAATAKDAVVSAKRTCDAQSLCRALYTAAGLGYSPQRLEPKRLRTEEEDCPAILTPVSSENFAMVNNRETKTASHAVEPLLSHRTDRTCQHLDGS